MSKSVLNSYKIEYVMDGVRRQCFVEALTNEQATATLVERHGIRRITICEVNKVP